MPNFWILGGDNIDALKRMPDNSVHAIVTDPPYGLSKEPDMAEVLSHWLNDKEYTHGGNGFMGNSWDSFVPSPTVWRECFRVLKDGGHMVAFAGSRTYDLMAVSVRLAGFEIRDQIMWVYGSGFPHALDVGKSIDKIHGAERDKIPNPLAAKQTRSDNTIGGIGESDRDFITTPATPDALKFDGWKTALKPAHEPIVLARKPLRQTVAANVLENGTGALNIKGCEIESGEPIMTNRFTKGAKPFGGAIGCEFETTYSDTRYPANFITDGSPEVYNRLPTDARRFFYAAKASKADREEGLTNLETRTLHRVNAGGLEHDPKFKPIERKNIHPTVKPTDLMQWLCRLITPVGGVILDPFAGSGSTGKAAIIEGFDFVGLELDTIHCDIARARCEWAQGYRGGTNETDEKTEQQKLF